MNVNPNPNKNNPIGVKPPEAPHVTSPGYSSGEMALNPFKNLISSCREAYPVFSSWLIGGLVSQAKDLGLRERRNLVIQCGGCGRADGKGRRVQSPRCEYPFLLRPLVRILDEGVLEYQGREGTQVLEGRCFFRQQRLLVVCLFPGIGYLL